MKCDRPANIMRRFKNKDIYLHTVIFVNFGVPTLLLTKFPRSFLFFKYQIFQNTNWLNIL